jgi:deoxycytidylate deaminase
MDNPIDDLSPLVKSDTNPETKKDIDTSSRSSDYDELDDKKMILTQDLVPKKRPRPNESAFEQERQSFFRIFCDLSFALAERSEDPKTKVGCVIVSDKCQVLGMGYNAWPKEVDMDQQLPEDVVSETYVSEYMSMDFTMENSKLTTKDCIMHAEMNAILHSTINLNTVPIFVFTTMMPCPNCMKTLLQYNLLGVFFHADFGKYPLSLQMISQRGVPMLPYHQFGSWSDLYGDRPESIQVDVRQIKAAVTPSKTMFGDRRFCNPSKGPLAGKMVNKIYRNLKLMVVKDFIDYVKDVFHIK